MIEWAIIIILAAAGGAGWYMAYKAQQEMTQLEGHIISIHNIITDYKIKVGQLFALNIHYYDDTIFQFIEDTKAVKAEIDNQMSEYDELKQYIYDEEPPKEDEEKAFLGVVKGALHK
jgi:cell division protein FtsL